MLRNPYVLAGLSVAAAILFAVLVVAFFGNSGGGSGNENLGSGAQPGLKSSGVDWPPLALHRHGHRPRGPRAPSTSKSVPCAPTRMSTSPVATAIRPGFKSFSPQLQFEGLGAQLGAALARERRRNRRRRGRHANPASDGSTDLDTAAGAGNPYRNRDPGRHCRGRRPDLAVSVAGNNCAAGTPLTAVLSNVGSQPILGRTVVITVSTASGTIGTAGTSVNLQPGETVSVATGTTVQPTRTTLRAQLAGEPPETALGNNIVDCVQTGPTAQPPPIGGGSGQTPTLPAPGATPTPNLSAPGTTPTPTP